MKVFRIFQTVLRKLFGKRQANALERYAEIDESAIVDRPLRLRLDNPDTSLDRKYLRIGKDCVVHGFFIFESQEGFISVGERTFIGGSTFICRTGISVGNNVYIAWGCTIYDHDSHSINYLDRMNDMDVELYNYRERTIYKSNQGKNWSVVNTAPITICNHAWIGMNCIILKGVTIGEGAVVGAGSVVTRDVPAWTLVAGNPARIIKAIPH